MVMRHAPPYRQGLELRLGLGLRQTRRCLGTPMGMREVGFVRQYCRILGKVYIDFKGVSERGCT